MVKKFNMIDEGFVCLNCHKRVLPLGYSARDHCNFCLCSLHVDNNPGDRCNDCHGILRPIGIEKFRDSYKIIYRCDRCHMIKKNVMARDDNFDEIIRLSKEGL